MVSKVVALMKSYRLGSIYSMRNGGFSAFSKIAAYGRTSIDANREFEFIILNLLWNVNENRRFGAIC